MRCLARTVSGWRSAVLGLAALGVGAAAVGGVDARADSYPERDITNVVVWSAGGGTDVLNRLISAEMEQHLPVSILVTNRPGGVAGSNGMSYVMGRPADGYTLVGLSESVVTAGVMGGWGERMEVWHPFIVGGSPDVISVNANAPYETLEELIAAAAANPDSIRASASGAGSIHHLNLLALENGAGVKFRFVPYPGSAPAQNAAMTGEVTVVVTSLAEQAQLIAGGQLRPLAMLTPDAASLGDVAIPSSFDAYPQLSDHLPIGQAIGMAIRADAPPEVIAVVEAAFNAAMASDVVIAWAAENHYQLSGLTGADAQAEFARLESLFGWTLHELGSAEVDPASLGIPRP